MWRKFDNLKTIYDTGMILIVRTDTAEEAIKVADYAIAGGVKAIEVPYAVPDCLEVIKTLSKKYKDQGVVVGAGTVTNAETAQAAILAGAEVLVSPNLNPEMIRVANEFQCVTMSGAMTPAEVYDTMKAGADIVKLFPAEIYKPAYLKSLRAPMPQAPISPTGGTNPDNVGEWIAAGAVCFGVASYITKAHKADGDYNKITEAAKTFLKAIQDGRAALKK